nr:EOG090X081J [Triops cancriformis]
MYSIVFNDRAYFHQRDVEMYPERYLDRTARYLRPSGFRRWISIDLGERFGVRLVRLYSKHCTALENWITNAAIFYQLDRSVAIVECKEGYELAAGKVLLCTAFGVWLGYAGLDEHCKSCAYTKRLVQVLVLVVLLCCASPVAGLGKIIYAVNAGGESHTDVYGIRYEADALDVGTASDYGTHLLNIGRVPQADGILYQTERYHTSTFGYDIPITQDGDYVLVLKFCEVYFTAPNMKVFDVVLNGVHPVVSYLDIFEKVGRGIAHDEYIPFRVQNGKVMVNNEESDLANKKIRVEFIKGNRDNPKINAIYVMKGKLEDVPKLPPMPSDDEDLEEIPNKVEEPKAESKKRKPSGPRASDPYATDQTSSMIPIFIAIGCFLPVLFCLCKL